MHRFTSAREAKEFLAGKIVEEARQEDVPFSEIEEKMLYFSETHWSLPDIYAVNEAFEREYSTEEYEQKVAMLIRNLLARLTRDDSTSLDRWHEAVHLLRSEDHYIVVLIGRANGNLTSSAPNPVSQKSRRMMQLVGNGVVAGLLVIILMLILHGLRR